MNFMRIWLVQVYWSLSIMRKFDIWKLHISLQILLVDSRSLLEYNNKCILNAINVSCSKLLKRRLQQDKVSCKSCVCCRATPPFLTCFSGTPLCCDSALNNAEVGRLAVRVSGLLHPTVPELQSAIQKAGKPIGHWLIVACCGGWLVERASIGSHREREEKEQ